MTAGARAFFHKPFDAAAFLCMIKSALKTG
jgi:hypothetical protein